MKFYYKKLILWMKNGNVREVKFEPNKVNIITGGSETGKSSILAIIDYCFFEEKNIKITKEVINENVEWYGINFFINDKTYTIARRSLNGTTPSKDYYFSSNGEIPEKPHASISEITLKNIINKEFQINKNTIVPYGGDKIKAGSKISIKYFMLFNSLDENTIDNSDTFFNKQTDRKYQEALERTFDLALGIASEEDVINKERINEINKELNKYERKQKVIDNRISSFYTEKVCLIKKAKELDLIPSNIIDIDEAINLIVKICEGKKLDDFLNDNEVVDELFQEEKKIKSDIRAINDFLNQLNTYENVNLKNIDSLKPINYLVENYGELINHPSVEDIIWGLKSNYENIVIEAKKIKKNDFGMKDEIKNLKERLQQVQEKIDKCVIDNKGDKDIFSKYIFIGEARAKLELYNNKDSIETDFSEKIDTLEGELKELQQKLQDNEQKKISVIRLIEISAQMLMNRCKNVLETYSNYLPVFNYREKKLELMNPKVAEISKIVGSSSNYLFLHIFLFLALHEVVMAQNIKYIPSYIILDQPSRPYYDNKNDEFKDKEKITSIIQLLDYYISYINKEYKEEFQFIVFEHIPKEIWINMSNVHLVEEFKNENKLIRKCDISV
ncbi:MAG: DUF3732 domain-containing protein [Clostridium butyricum]|nr:DUF3732 domain-containing protein [Clostridium butyricum]